MSKKKNTPAEELIKSVIGDLKGSPVDSSAAAKDPTEIISAKNEVPSDPSAYTIDGEGTQVPNFQSSDDVEVKTSFGARPSAKTQTAPTASSTDAQLMQAESLRMAQQRITELEKECEKLREENEFMSSAANMTRQRVEEMQTKIDQLEKDRAQSAAQAQAELNIFKESAGDKDMDILKARKKIEELEVRLSLDLRKIRVRERELENRLELAKLEKTALVRSKDDTILELKAKIDSLGEELEDYRNRCTELNSKIEGHQDQLNRTMRALRLALTNLEANENTDLTVAPLKKAE